MKGKLKILIVEDNPSDAMLVRMALEQEGLEFDAHVAEDGDAAVGALCQDGHHDSRPHPDLVILDLNLPKRDGTEVLRAIRGEECLVSATVVVLSSSPEDVIEQRVSAANVAADCYVTKPPSLDEFLAIGKVIRQCHEMSRSRRS